ncbi:mas-related G-protein coupled receptor member E [Dasypus novemcinctus]|uniref:mas-related G-protein coupled receptor member E n=1 Tax=Dasypus novemcinctus TaxID=9361 RepID=UPI00265FBFE4|nr:mas-related G-protein coupled receptor member E [Dasypus novemcinctus]
MDPTEPREHTGPRGDLQEDEAFSLVVLSLTEALGLAGLLGNGALLWLLGSTVYRNPCAIYLLDTACADLIFLGCHMVAIVPDLLPGQSGIPGFVQASLAALRFFCYLVRLALLAAVSAEQCAAALPGARCPCRRPRHLATALCALSWALCLLLHLLLSGACSQPFGAPGRAPCRAAWLAAAALVAALSAAVCVASLLLLLRAERGPQRAPPGAFPRLVLLSALLFLFGDLPFGIYWLARSLRWRAPRRFHALSLLAAGLDRAAKPVVCFCLGRARGRGLRQPLALVLRRALGEDAEPGAGSETPRRGLVEETA